MTDFGDLEELVRLVGRAFYTDECIVVLEALLRYRIVKDEDLAATLKLQAKQLRQILTRLKEDQLVTCKQRGEKKEGTGERVHQHIFWYIDYRHFVHAVKYRLYLMQRILDSEETQEIDQYCYYCPNELCQAKYNSLDASKLVGMDGAFHCEQCNVELRETEQAQCVSRIQERRQGLMQSLRPIIERLRLAEKITLPADAVPKLPKIQLPNAKGTGPGVHGPAGAAAPKAAVGSTFNLAGMPLSTNMEVVVDLEGYPAASSSSSAPAFPVPGSAGAAPVPSPQKEAPKAPPPWMSAAPAQGLAAASSSSPAAPSASPSTARKVPGVAARKRARSSADGPPFALDPAPALVKQEPVAVKQEPGTSGAPAPAAASAPGVDRATVEYFVEYYSSYIQKTAPHKLAEMRASGEIERMAAAQAARGPAPLAPVKQEPPAADATRPAAGAASASAGEGSSEEGGEEEEELEASFEEEAGEAGGEAPAEPEGEEDFCTVQGVRKRVREVTEEDREAMSADEYRDYYAKCEAGLEHFMDM